MMSVDEPTNQGVKEDDKGGTQGGKEEKQLLALRHLARAEGANKSDEVQEEERCQAHRCVPFRPSKVL